MQITPSAIADRLDSQVESIVRELLPHGKKQGHEWAVGGLSGEPGESLKIAISGDKAGVWKDFATGDAGGDILDLYCAVNGCNLTAALDWACKRLGIDRPVLHNGPARSYKEPEVSTSAVAAASAPAEFAWLATRGIKEEVIRKYRLAADSGAVLFPFFRDGKVKHIQYRAITEKKFWASKDTELILFGWQAIQPRAREVLICEGPMDALSWSQYGFDALSVPNGAGKNTQWIATEFPHLERFDKIYVAMDNDAAGQIAAAEIVERLGRHRCFVVELPEGIKDANEALTKGIPDEIVKSCVKNARTMDPPGLSNVGDYAREVLEIFYPPTGKRPGIGSPFRGHDENFRFDPGATTVLAGWNGSGKSTIIGQLALSAMAQDFNVCVSSLEFRVPRYVSWLVRQGLCAERPEKDAIQEAVAKLSRHLWAFGSHGEAKIDEIISAWEYAGARYGCRLYVLDNLSKLSTSSADNENHEQKAAMTKITEFAVRTNGHVIVAAHSRKGLNEHERVGKLDIKGSGAITDLADAVLLLHRNKRKSKALQDRTAFAELSLEEQVSIEQQPDAWLSCEKNRHGTSEETVRLWFDLESRQYIEQPKGVPRRYL
jgi:twinkle protein